MRAADTMYHFGMQRTVHATSFLGDVMTVPVPPCQDIWQYGLYLDAAEIDLCRYLIAHLQPGDTFYDVGANIGFFSLLAARTVGANGKVLAFEPCPEVLPMLLENVAATENIEVISIALSSAEGLSTFHMPPRANMVSSSLNSDHVAATPGGNQSRKIRVATATLDKLIEDGASPPSIVKVDVEGAEPLVIEGARLSLAKHKPDVILEVSFEKSIAEGQEAIDMMSEVGYAPCNVTSEGTLEAIPSIEDLSTAILEDPFYFHNLVNLVFRHSDQGPPPA